MAILPVPLAILNLTTTFLYIFHFCPNKIVLWHIFTLIFIFKLFKNIKFLNKMPLAKSSKFRAQMAASNQSPLPLATLCLLGAILLDQINVGTALRCYQGQQSIQQPIQGSPTECPTQSYTCIKTVDYSQGLGYALRACSSTNCSTGGGGYIQTTYNAFCINSTGYPPSTYCCCYGDGCNSATALGSSMGGIGLAFIGLMAALALLKNGGGSGRII